MERVKRVSRDQRGNGSGSVTVMLLAPLLMGALFTAIQIGVWWQGHQTAVAASEAAAEAARVERAAPGVAQSAAHTVAAQGGLDDVIVTVDRSDPTAVTVTVTGSVGMFVDVPGLFGISASSTMPVERVTEP